MFENESNLCINGWGGGGKHFIVKHSTNGGVVYGYGRSGLRVREERVTDKGEVFETQFNLFIHFAKLQK